MFSFSVSDKKIFFQFYQAGGRCETTKKDKKDRKIPDVWRDYYTWHGAIAFITWFLSEIDKKRDRWTLLVTQHRKIIFISLLSESLRVKNNYSYERHLFSYLVDLIKNALKLSLSVCNYLVKLNSQAMNLISRVYHLWVWLEKEPRATDDALELRQFLCFI